MTIREMNSVIKSWMESIGHDMADKISEQILYSYQCGYEEGKKDFPEIDDNTAITQLNNSGWMEQHDEYMVQMGRNEILNREKLKHGDCDKCSREFGSLGCCTTVSNEWKFSCDEGMIEYAKNEAYKQGLNDAWEAATKVVNSPLVNHLEEIFDITFPEDVLPNVSASEAIQKIKIYENKTEIDDGFKVGDIITDEENNYLIIKADDNSFFVISGKDFEPISIGKDHVLDCYRNVRDRKDLNRFVTGIMEKIKAPQMPTSETRG